MGYGLVRGAPFPPRAKRSPLLPGEPSCSSVHEATPRRRRAGPTKYRKGAVAQLFPQSSDEMPTPSFTDEDGALTWRSGPKWYGSRGGATTACASALASGELSKVTVP